MRRKRPSDWREIVQETYEEEGQALGRAIMLDSSREPDFWEILGPLDLWPRWYLFAFATLYRENNVAEYNRAKANRWWRKRAAAKRTAALEATRKVAHKKLS